MDIQFVEKSHPYFETVNNDGLELILDYNEDRTSGHIKDNHATIHVETIGKFNCFVLSLTSYTFLAPLQLNGEGIYSLS